MNIQSQIILPAVMRVMPENVTPLWPQLEALFAPALRMVSTHNAEDVRRSLMALEAQLWAQMDGDIVEAAATSEFVRYPAGMFVRVWLAGARRDRKLNEDAFLALLDQWRQAHGCVGFEAIGRHGWLRKFPEARVQGLIMRWPA
jgi:hypothetical protein